MNSIVKLPFDDHSCGWYAALPEPLPPRRLSGPHKADHVVVGAGFAGLAAARRLASHMPQARILLVDAQRIGYGASGRNSGFVIDLPHKFALEHPNPEHKQRLLSLNRAAIDQLQGLIQRHHIDCQWSHAGKFQGAVGPRGLAYLEHFRKLMDDLGEPYEVVERQALAEVLGTQHYSRAIYTPGCYLMQPAALVRGLGDSLPANVEVYEESPIQRLEKTANGWRLHANDGLIDTPQVLLGTSIFTQEFGYLRNRLLPVMTFASWTRPLSDDEMARIGAQADWGLTPADHAGTTVRMTQDRRLIIRNTYRHVPRYGRSVDEATRRRIRQDHQQALLARYPQLAKVPFTHTWGGVYAISRNFTNFFGQLEDGVFATACDNGVGAAWGTVSGTLLADLAVGAGGAQLDAIQAVTGMPSRNPPEPFLGLGVSTRIRWAAWNSRSEL
ncbi:MULTISPECIES: NAD(P)/FAD-dependent oxidoreductase [unclassified Pseudomonas]|uniref:NAD(P)/FAD-dependent oxidoreductase n=1 Tax=unclassified Pseudomonas TaxID=196821 RepID=UPI0035BFAA81